MDLKAIQGLLGHGDELGEVLDAGLVLRVGAGLQLGEVAGAVEDALQQRGRTRPGLHQLLELLQQRDELADLIDPKAEPAHARVDFDVHVRDRACFRSGLVESLEHVATVNNGGEFVLNTSSGLAGPETGETKHRLRDACVA